MTHERSADASPRKVFVSAEAAALAGLACAVIWSVSVLLLERQPGLGASAAEVTQWYGVTENRVSILLGLNLMPFGSIALLWFVAVIRRRLGAREDQFFSTVFVGSGNILAVLLVVSAAAASVPTLVAHYGGQGVPDREILEVSRGLWYGLFLVSSARFAAVFMIVTSTLGLRFKAFPRWLVLGGYACAALLFLTDAFSGSLAILFPLWLATVSITMMVSGNGLTRRRKPGGTAA